MNSVYVDGYKELELVPLCLYTETHELLMVLSLTKGNFNANFCHDDVSDNAARQQSWYDLEITKKQAKNIR